MNDAKYPQFAKMRDELEAEKVELLKKSEPLRKQRDDLLAKVQPLEEQLREVNNKIKEVERPRLAEIDSQLGKLAVAMGGRAMNADAGNTLEVAGTEIVG